MIDKAFNTIKGAKYITRVDARYFFYQFAVAVQDRWKFAIDSHRGQKRLKIAPMGYCNSIQHVQRILDDFLRDMDFAHGYVDDIRGLNKISPKDTYRLPLHDDLIDKIRYSYWYGFMVSHFIIQF